MQEFETFTPGAVVPSRESVRKQFTPLGDELGAQLQSVRLSNIELAFEPAQIRAMLDREGQANYLPPELARRIQEVTIASGLSSTKLPCNRKELKGSCDTLESQIEWLEKKIAQIDAHDRPTATTRADEFESCKSAALANFNCNAGSVWEFTRVVGTIIGGIAIGCLAGSFFAAAISAGVIIGITTYGLNCSLRRVLDIAESNFHAKELRGEADYQEPINARLIEIYARHESTPFSSDRERRIALQSDLLDFQHSLEQTQNALRGLTTDLHALGLALKHASPVSEALINERQVLQSLDALEQRSLSSPTDAAIIAKALECLIGGKEYSAIPAEMAGDFKIIRAMRAGGHIVSPQIEEKLRRLQEKSTARGEL